MASTVHAMDARLVQTLDDDSFELPQHKRPGICQSIDMGISDMNSFWPEQFHVFLQTQPYASSHCSIMTQSKATNPWAQTQQVREGALDRPLKSVGI